MRAIRFNFLNLLTVILLGVTPASAEVKLSALFADNMVLQTRTKVPVWGTAAPGERITVILNRQRGSTAADDAGRWKIELDPMNTGGPFEMTVEGTNKLTIRNVAVGEVWVCSGQSNMEMAVGNSPRAWGGVLNAEQEIASGDYPMIRHFTVKKGIASQPQADVEGQWVAADPQTVGEFSATAYFFAREIHKALGVPVGLIHTSWSGTPAEAWTSRLGLQSDPELRPILEDWEKQVRAYSGKLNDFRRQLDDWEAGAQKAEAEGARVPTPPTWAPDPRSNSWRATGLFNAMIAPLIPFAIRGVIWYQGESNSGRARAYQCRRLFPEMIRDWRRAWGQGDFPFLFVQLANFNSPGGPYSWAEIREAQLMTLALPNTGMAVAADIGDSVDIHPKNKQEVGRCLSLAALTIAYGHELVYSGPIYESMKIEGTRIRLRFKHVDGGLVAKGGGKSLRGFEIAGEDRRFLPAEARIAGNTVVVRSRQVVRPAAIRYAWGDDPECSLYNQGGLPASPFRTDDSPGVTAGAR